MLGIFGCSEYTPDTPPARVLASRYFDLSLGGTPFQAQLAVTSREIGRGLMFRKMLGANQGMLFIHRSGSQAKYWMRNVPIPLSIGFFDAAGILLETHELYPYDETTVTSSSESVTFALEMNAGWFSQQAIRPGDQLDLDAVRNALQTRGFDPDHYLPLLPGD